MPALPWGTSQRNDLLYCWLKHDVQVGPAPRIMVNLIGCDQVAQAGKLGCDETVRGRLIGIGTNPTPRNHTTLRTRARILKACMGGACANSVGGNLIVHD